MQKPHVTKQHRSVYKAYNIKEPPGFKMPVLQRTMQTKAKKAKNARDANVVAVVYSTKGRAASSRYRTTWTLPMCRLESEDAGTGARARVCV
jgi:uncharacterized protein (UPF0128 family)